MKIKVEQVGNPRFPRYILTLENKTYFDGTGWTPNQKKAIRYAKLATARDDWRKLQAEMKAGLTVLTATIRVTVKAAQDLTPKQIEELAFYMSEASTFFLDYSKAAPCWLEIVSSQLVWSSLKKK